MGWLMRVAACQSSSMMDHACVFRAGGYRRPTSVCPVYLGMAYAQCSVPCPTISRAVPRTVAKRKHPEDHAPVMTSHSSGLDGHSQLPICSPGRCSHGEHKPSRSALTLNICFTLCRGRFTLSLCSSCRTSLMLRLPSPFLSASSNVCFSHFGAELGANTVHGPDLACSSLQPRRQGARVPSPSTPSYLPFTGRPYPGG